MAEGFYGTLFDSGVKTLAAANYGVVVKRQGLRPLACDIIVAFAILAEVLAGLAVFTLSSLLLNPTRSCCSLDTMSI
jgi:hypothetical protein